MAPGRYEAYERLLEGLAEGQVWMLLWQGRKGSPDAQYGGMEVAGHGYVPCVTGEEQLAKSGWNRAHEVVSGRDIASALYPDRWGLWLDPHTPGGGVGVPWLDLRRVVAGLTTLPAGPLRISEPSVDVQQFYALLGQNAHRTPAVRTLTRAWVQPALGEPYLAIGLDLYDAGEQSVTAARRMMQDSVAAVPSGLPVSSVALADDFDPVAMWMRANARPFFDRGAFGGGPAGAPSGYGYPPAPGWRPAG
ncbi:enhanced serine sensitivity protein SseB C-terminal domain-containing protein [Streptomyces sp. NPDC051940]|uniref:enhanced serine sensitivity protein SseB C-terminal domain-containing protein n=1 Tax=Streptomyces sp. NPDC051940 TaxID=3155675 RepID=UPI003413590C